MFPNEDQVRRFTGNGNLRPIGFALKSGLRWARPPFGVDFWRAFSNTDTKFPDAPRRLQGSARQSVSWWESALRLQRLLACYH